ncbi:hypothetical protein [Labrys wisconsinensis]|uniref:Rhodanese-related sulfurtransferase n=1 Tax=Labrys wisconsinensis TaxID=425677 RepID=A0ABU0JAL6_9HYPH|nr:hypothetical protein [Labrys wisconsinensis]MDQ0471311.1 rhodanese-related sulfurtransferase [Labrys wisconsinensis]
MKLYLVQPNLPAGADRATVDARLRACIEPIADLILSHLSEDPALFAIRHKDEVSEPCIPPEISYGYAEVAGISDPVTLRKLLLACGDPFDERGVLIRSLVTCRAVFYGYDGQAFVCLPSEADPIQSPDAALITVTECSHRLTDSHWMDGLSP